MPEKKNVPKDVPLKGNDGLEIAGHQPVKNIEKGHQPITEGHKPTVIGRVENGFQPTQGNLDVTNPPKGGSGVPTKASDSSKTANAPTKNDLTKQS